MMGKRLFERCPKCEQDLSTALFRYFWNGYSDYAEVFEYTCGGCGAKLEIDVEPVQQFYCTLKAENDKGGDQA